jgi:hypothetical protein
MNPKDQHDAEMEPEPSAEERAEAEALARALEPDATGSTSAPDEALAAAALLRHARRMQAPDESARTEARLAAAGARALSAVDQRRPRRGWWLLPALLVPAAAAAALVVMTALTPGHRGSVAISTGAPMIPAPPVTLLAAQAQAAHAGADLAALDRQMRAYRMAYYAAVAGGGAEEP